MKMRTLTLTFGAALAACASAFAAPIVTVPTKSVAIGNTSDYFFDVGFLGTAGEGVGAYDYRFSVVPNGAVTGSITFTGDYAVATTNSLFPGSNPGQSANLIVSDGLGSGTQPLADSKALFRALFTVAPGTSGRFDINPVSAQSVLRDLNGNAIAGVTFTSGSITVTPEPTSLGLLGLGGLALLRRRAR